MTTAFETAPTSEVNVVTNALYLQLMSVMGLKKANWVTRSLFPIFRSPVEYMSRLLVDLDQNIDHLGWNQAVKQFLGNFITDVQISGAEKIPTQGALLVVGNHPAAYDIAVLIAAIERDDLKIIASDVQFVQLLPNVASHSIPVPYNIPHRLGTVRSALQHLKNGGAVFIFPRGNVEPDPAVSPGAMESMSGWSPSVELFLRMVPQTKSVVAISSGMLSRKWYNNPLVKLWKKYEQRQKVAEIFQIASQILTRRKPAIAPKVNFSVPLTVDDLGGSNAPEGKLLKSLIEQAKFLLAQHMQV